MKLIVGLGNPGREYEKTRHNAGFLVVEEAAKKLSVSFDKKGFQGEYTVFFHKGEKVILLKPQTYMNNSGFCVGEIVNYYDIDHEDILIIHDDLDLPLGSLRLRTRGSSGGQKGMASILDALQDQKIKRIRVGISHDRKIDTKDYVLGGFHGEEEELFKEAVNEASDAVICWLDNDFDTVMNRFNKTKEKEKENEK